MTSQEDFANLKLQLEDIEVATNHFSDENLIGEGGFGKVYIGNLSVSGEPTDIAARKLHYDYGQGDYEFWNEISMLATLKHNNLVSLIGFCDDKGQKIIVTKREVNKSLDQHLSDPTLTWTQRLRICVEVARALKYIHCDKTHDSSVIHRNIKSSKVLLDENWKPKLSGFELAKANTKARRHRLVLAERSGTLGYVDPSYDKTGFESHKSDVYSFGVMLFEVLCGRKAFVLKETEQDPPQAVEQDLTKTADPHPTERGME
ncbi:putative serine/threonine-protein kinase PBL28 [Bidens hawaiensis]|uniref:putative serine/threonine-protein kinase PBL28 n=1 Tax=Bidens hawaiensis TaxID=980011 RepID=UPI00404AE830